MRILLLLTAFLAALGGAVTGTAANAQPIESSASIAPVLPARAAAHAYVAASPLSPAALGQAVAWYPVAADVALAARPLFGDRLRE